jgi:hypothetical protein
MVDFDWEKCLHDWNERLLASDVAYELPDEVRSSGWAGFPPATDAQIAAADQRLGIPLPPSYRAFLIRGSNCWISSSSLPACAPAGAVAISLLSQLGPCQ